MQVPRWWDILNVSDKFGNLSTILYHPRRRKESPPQKVFIVSACGASANSLLDSFGGSVIPLEDPGHGGRADHAAELVDPHPRRATRGGVAAVWGPVCAGDLRLHAQARSPGCRRRRFDARCPPHGGRVRRAA